MESCSVQLGIWKMDGLPRVCLMITHKAFITALEAEVEAEVERENKRSSTQQNLLWGI